MLTIPQHAPSAWVRRFAPLIRRHGRVLDLAAGAGRHTRLLLDMGLRVIAVDREVTALQPFAGERCEVRALDLETGAPPHPTLSPSGGEGRVRGWPLGDGYDGIVVTNYLHRPLFAPIATALAPGGVLIYETFAAGNERFGRPRNPDFLLQPGELLAAFAALSIVAFEQGEVAQPRPAMIQRIAAVNGSVGMLPPASHLEMSATQE